MHNTLTTPGVRPGLGVVITWMLAHNIVYTFIAPFVARAGLSARVDVVLLVFGLAALIMFVLLTTAFVSAWRARIYGFTPGARHAGDDADG